MIFNLSTISQYLPAIRKKQIYRDTLRFDLISYIEMFVGIERSNTQFCLFLYFMYFEWGMCNMEPHVSFLFVTLYIANHHIMWNKCWHRHRNYFFFANCIYLQMHKLVNAYDYRYVRFPTLGKRRGYRGVCSLVSP